MSHPLSLAFLTLYDCGPVEAIRTAGETGYDLIGLRLLPAAPTEAPYGLMTDPVVLKEAQAALRDTGIKVADIEIARLKPETDVREFERFLENGAALGARNILVAGDDPDHARLTQTYGAFCQLAEQYGMTADLEFMPWTKVPDLKSALKIVEGAEQDNGAILVDALHFDRSQTTLEEVRGLPRSRMNYVQLCDGPSEYGRSDEELIYIARGGRLMPGDGGIDCVSLVKAIPDGVPISLEIPNHDFVRGMTPKERAALALNKAKEIITQAGRSTGQ